MSDCKSFNRDLDAYLDGELDSEKRDQFERHLESCEKCRAALQQARAIESGIRKVAENWQASSGLWQRITESAAQQKNSSTTASRAGRSWRWMSAALLLITVGVTGFGLWQKNGQHNPEHVASALINEFHTFVVSHRELDFSDSHPAEIRNWFGDKVDFRVPLPVRTADMRLAGGRLCNMLDQRVVSFMYKAEGAWVSLYIRQSATDGHPPGSSHELLLDGYGFIGWENQGLFYSLVGDLPVERLRAIAERLRSTRVHTLTPPNPGYYSRSQA